MILGSFQSLVIVRQRRERHRDLMRIGSNRLKVVLMREKGVRRSNEAAAQIRSHRLDHIFLPQKAVPAAGSEIRHAQTWHAAQALNLAFLFQAEAGIRDIEIELAQLL